MCEHAKTVCPRHEGGFDCTPFCDICEGEQEFCPTCDEYASAEFHKVISKEVKDLAKDTDWRN